MGEEFKGSEVAQSLVRSYGIVGLFPSLKFAVEFGDGERKGGDLIELLGVSAIGALHLAIEFGRAGQQDKELHASLLAGLLEDGGELAAAIHLQGAQRKGQTALEGIEEQLGRRGGAPVMDFKNIPARDYVASRELLSTTPGAGRKSIVSSCTRSPGFTRA